jgi:hypothetical protein
LPSALVTDHKTGLLMIAAEGEDGGGAGEPSGGEVKMAADMTEEQQLAHAISLSMGEAPALPPPTMAQPAARYIDISVDMRWPCYRLYDEIANIVGPMDTTRFSGDATTVGEIASGGTGWSLEPLMFQHQRAWIASTVMKDACQNGAGCAFPRTETPEDQYRGAWGDIHMWESADETSAGYPYGTIGASLCVSGTSGQSTKKGKLTNLLAWLPTQSGATSVASWVERGERGKPLKLTLTQLDGQVRCQVPCFAS